MIDTLVFLAIIYLVVRLVAYYSDNDDDNWPDGSPA